MRAQVFVMLARKNGVLAPDSAYKQHLEPRLVADAAALFAEKSAEWLCTMSTRDYLLAARALLHEETARATRVLHSSSLRPLLDAFDEYMLRRPLKELMQSGTVAAAIDAFVHSDGDAQVAAAAALEELRLAYEMISRLGNEGAVCFARVLYDRARNDGSLVIDMAHADDAIVQLVKLHRKYNSLVTLLAERAYTKQAPLHEAVVAAFKATMEHKIRDSTNTSAVPSVEVLATTVDTVIRKADAAQQWNLGSVEECCNGFVALLDHAPDKDHFHDEHRRHMTRRLLEADANMETEQLFLGMLKAVLGGNYAAKLATMFTDHEQAGATNKNFHAWAAGALPLPDFKVTVLTAGSWPLSPSPGGLVLPPLLQECMAAFASFYKTVTTNRTLSWVHESSRACLAYRHPSRPRPCELRMSALQALVCLAMPTTSEPCTVSELARRTGMANDELRRAVMGLSAGKSSTAVLNRTSSSGNLKKVDMADQLVLNDTFNPPKIVVTVPLPKVTVVKRDAKTGVAEICIHSRRYVCDAALVRVMKSRKTMAMAELTAEVIQQITQFRADPKMIKERIEDLMQREFLNRDEQNVHVLQLRLCVSLFVWRGPLTPYTCSSLQLRGVKHKRFIFCVYSKDKKHGTRGSRRNMVPTTAISQVHSGCLFPIVRAIYLSLISQFFARFIP